MANQAECEPAMTRQSNFDALRIVAMLMIVTWHVCIHGDLQSVISTDGARRMILQAIFAITVIGTNLYVVLTGYFQSRNTFKIGKLAKLWITVFFYSIGCAAIYLIFLHRLPENPALFCFPVITRAYWFVTVYVALYLLSPFLNRLLDNMNDRELRNLLMISFTAFSILPTFLPKGMALNPMDGHDILWFVTLYLTGAFLRRLDSLPYLRQRYIVLSYLLTLALLFMLPFVAKFLLSRYNIVSGIPTKLTMHYNSPLVYASSVLCFMMFKNFCFESLFVSKIAILTFGVYLIHDNPIVRDVLFKGVLKELFHKTMGAGGFLLAIIGSALIVFSAACCLDFFRSVLFERVGALHRAK